MSHAGRVLMWVAVIGLGAASAHAQQASYLIPRNLKKFVRHEP